MTWSLIVLNSFFNLFKPASIKKNTNQTRLTENININFRIFYSIYFGYVFFYLPQKYDLCYASMIDELKFSMAQLGF